VARDADADDDAGRSQADQETESEVHQRAGKRWRAGERRAVSADGTNPHRQDSGHSAPSAGLPHRQSSAAARQ